MQWKMLTNSFEINKHQKIINLNVWSSNHNRDETKIHFILWHSVGWYVGNRFRCFDRRLKSFWKMSRVPRCVTDCKLSLFGYTRTERIHVFVQWGGLVECSEKFRIKNHNCPRKDNDLWWAFRRSLFKKFIYFVITNEPGWESISSSGLP